MPDEVTRGEFDMLKSMVTDNNRRIDTIDSTGTRGVGVIQTQLTDLAKDVATVTSRLELHEKDHIQEAQDRIKQRRSAVRYYVTTLIAFLVLVEAPLLYLVSQHATGG